MSYDSLKEEQYRQTLETTACHLPKYQDEPWADVVKQDRGYARWVSNTLTLDEDLAEALAWGVENLYD